MMNYQPRKVILTLFPLLLALELFVTIQFFPEIMRGQSDARQFYVGAYMLRSGFRHDFYDPASQKYLEDHLVSHMQGMLPVNHPAIEYLLWVPFSLLSYGKACAAFAVFSCLVLVACSLVLRDQVDDGRLLGATFFGFLPVTMTLLQSQDSILLLLLACLAYVTENELLAGLLIGFGVFKFALVLPIAVLYLFWRRWRFVAGFGVSSAALAAGNLLLIGLPQNIQYVHFIFATQYLPSKAFPNLRGLIGVLGGGPWLAVGASLVLLLLCSRAKPSLTLALAVGLMTSYQTLPYDLVLLLIGVCVEKRWITYVGSVFGILHNISFLCAIPVLVEQFFWYPPFAHAIVEDRGFQRTHSVGTKS